jgi:ferredoxin
MTFSPTEPELLPGASPEQDCAPALPAAPEIETGAEDADDEAEAADDEDDDEPEDEFDPARAPAQTPSPSGWQPRPGGLLRLIERIALAVERRFQRLTGAAQLNPFYHSGTLAVLLWVLVAASGLYLTLFYQYGFDAAYRSLTRIEASLVSRTIRSLHRYGSDLAVIFTVLHGLRLLFQGRFRGPRWLAWVAGIGMAPLLWLVGVIGFFMVWDGRAQLIVLDLARLLGGTGATLLQALFNAEAANTSWLVMILAWGLHTGLFIGAAVFFYYHIVRLNRPKFIPPWFWLAAVSAALLIVSALFPQGLLPKADFTRLPEALRLDPLFLFYLPLETVFPPAGLWLGLAAVTALALALPWAGRRPPPVVPVTIHKDRCTGCTKCSLDCPYKAIQMVERTDGRPHKFIAIENPALCVGCGVCVGSCDVAAISLGSLSQEALWRAIQRRLEIVEESTGTRRVPLVFTCERHAAHAAAPWLERPDAAVIALPCVAAAPPNLVGRALELGASEARLVGCPPDDCARREGNLWSELRFTRQRLPKLKKVYEQAPITRWWLPPDEFGRADPAAPGLQPAAPAQYAPALGWRSYLAGALLALLAALAQTAVSIPFTPQPQEGVTVLLAMPDPALAFTAWRARPQQAPADWPERLVLEVDGAASFERVYDPQALAAGRTPALFEQVILPPGGHRLRLLFTDGGITRLLVDETVDLAPGALRILIYPPAGR